MIDTQTRDRVLAEVDALADDLVQMTIDTVRIPSVNPTYPGIDQEAARGGETRVNEFCKPLMEDVGLQTDMWEAEEGRANLVGKLSGAGGGRSLLFNGHVDVVPPGPDANWTKAGPWSGEVIDGQIWGPRLVRHEGRKRRRAHRAAGGVEGRAAPQGRRDHRVRRGRGDDEHRGRDGAAIERGYTADAAIVAEASGPPYPLGHHPGLARPAVHGLHDPGPGGACLDARRADSGGRRRRVQSASPPSTRPSWSWTACRRLEEEWGQTKSHPMFKRPGHFTIYPGLVQGGPTGRS